MGLKVAKNMQKSLGNSAKQPFDAGFGAFNQRFHHVSSPKVAARPCFERHDEGPKHRSEAGGDADNPRGVSWPGLRC